MFYKVIFSFILLFCIFSQSFAFEKVEDVFSDIQSDYTYKEELQFLYDNDIIKPDINGNFNPYKLLTREEFVGVLLETNCTKCTKPNTSFYLIDQFQDKNVYYDVYNNTDYFYCISEADSKGFIQGYEEGTQCENGDARQSEIPFCPYNTIILEEALAIVMRTGNILTQSQAENIISLINNDNGAYPDLSDDVRTINTDGSIYNFYPYFLEAEKFILTEYNNLGERKDFSLLDKIDNKYNPKKSINREDFLRLATFSLKNSSCREDKNTEISGMIELYNQGCSDDESTCKYENELKTSKPIDVVGNIDTICPLGFGDNISQKYNWVVRNMNNNTEILLNGVLLNDYIFPNSGDYKIDLYVTDLCNNTSQFSKFISVDDEVINDFSLSANYINNGDLNIDFSSYIKGNDGPYSFSWNFGDGNTSNEQNPNHTYTDFGLYDVILTVIDSKGNIKKIPIVLNLYDKGFNAMIQVAIDESQDNSFNFYGITDSNNPNFSYKWDFGDGNTSNEQNPNHIYSQSGRYKVMLTVIDEFGNEKEVITFVTVGNGGFKDSIKMNFNSNTNIDFRSIIAGGNGPFEYNWDFGDGNTSVEQNPNHIYSEPGTYNVLLNLEDSDGNSKIIETTITIGDNGFSSMISVTDTINPFEFEFEGIVIGGSGPFEYSWDFGDGKTSNEKSPNYMYGESGIYPVTLIITDSQGNIQTNTTTVVVGNSDLNINISTQSQYNDNETLSIEFEGIVTGGIGPFTYLWDFEDGTTSTLQNPNHNFTSPGLYTVSFTVVDSIGNSRITSTQIFVSEIDMNINIGSNPTNNPGEFNFNSLVNGGTGPFEYDWDFGDGNTSNEQNPTHTYSESGTYEVILSVVDSNGNIQIITTTVVVIVNGEDNENMNISINATPMQGSGPLASTFSVFVNGGVGPYDYNWDFGDGTTGIGSNISNVFSEVGSYNVEITVTDSNENSITQAITINVTQGDIQGIDPNSDTDNDGVLDINDKCINVSGVESNDGCPIFETQCSSDADCPENSKCGSVTSGISTCIPIAFTSSCEYEGDSTVFGNVVCNTCPCEQSLDFNALLRNCDVVFPAITSPDGKEIFSQGDYYQIKK